MYGTWITPIKSYWIKTLSDGGIFTNFNQIDMKTCDECANYECDNFSGIGWCRLSNEMVLNDDLSCERYVELPDDGEK